MKVLHEPNLNLKLYFSKYPKLNFKKGETILHPQETSYNIFCIKSGLLRIFTINSEGKEVTIILLPPFPEYELILGIGGLIEKYYIEAITPVELFRVPSSEFMVFLTKNPLVHVTLAKTLSFLIKKLFEQIEMLKESNAIELLSEIIYYFGKFNGEEIDGKTKINVKITHQDFADITGLTRETITSQINKLQKYKKIKLQDGHIVINNLNNLTLYNAN